MAIRSNTVNTTTSQAEMMQQPIQHVLFDLGGVLVDFQGVNSLAAQLQLDPARMAEIWLASPAVRAYERGETDTETFTSSVVAELGGELTQDEFREQMASWLPGPLPGAFELLGHLNEAGVRHSCLSNTNAFHWDLMRSWSIDATLTETFLSHELGLVKPDREIFKTIVARLDLAPASIVFFDDHPVNVAAAQEFGLRAAQTVGPEPCRRWLEEHGLLPATR